MTNFFDLTGKNAIVTGANTGLGQGICLAFAQAGASIIAVGRSSMEETERLCRDAGARFHAIRADLSSLEPIERIVAESADIGRIDILVNNAGIIRRADAISFSEQDWDDVMNVNLKSTFFLSQAVARRMLADELGGKIINIASLLSFQGGIRIPSYTASKSGLAGLTRLLACEWAAKGINVNAIAPGYFVTNNTEALRTRSEAKQRDPRIVFLRRAGATPPISVVPPCSSRPRQPITSTESCFPSMGGGWHASD